MTRLRLPLSLTLLAAALVLLAGQPAYACMQPRCTTFFCPETTPELSGVAPGGTTLVTFTGADTALIQVGLYTTPEMSVTYACSTAFPVVPGIERIDSVRLVSLATGETLPN